MSPSEQETDALSGLEERIQKAVQLVNRLREERDAALAEASDARAQTAALAEEVSQTRHAREQAERLRADASAQTRRTAQHLREQGMAQRDISALLGISHQAVSQLLAS